MHNFLGGPVSMMVHMVQVAVMVPVVVAWICLLDGSPHAELRQPVHRGQATLEFGGHSSHRLKVEEETEMLSAVALGGSPGSLDGCCAAALAQVWKSRRFVYYVYSPLTAAETHRC